MLGCQTVNISLTLLCPLWHSNCCGVGGVVVCTKIEIVFNYRIKIGRQIPSICSFTCCRTNEGTLAAPRGHLESRSGQLSHGIRVAKLRSQDFLFDHFWIQQTASAARLWDVGLGYQTQPSVPRRPIDLLAKCVDDKLYRSLQEIRRPLVSTWSDAGAEHNWLTLSRVQKWPPFGRNKNWPLVSMRTDWQMGKLRYVCAQRKPKREKNTRPFTVANPFPLERYRFLPCYHTCFRLVNILICFYTIFVCRFGSEPIAYSSFFFLYHQIFLWFISLFWCWMRKQFAHKLAGLCCQSAVKTHTQTTRQDFRFPIYLLWFFSFSFLPFPSMAKQFDFYFDTIFAASWNLLR